MDKLRVLQLSFIAILSVVFVEGFIGLLVGSLAILSDAVHAVFDATTMIILLLTTRMALKPPDREHMYGYAKIESIGGMIGGIALLALAAILLFEAGFRITTNALPVHPEDVGFVAIFYTLGVDMFRVTLTSKAASSDETSVTVKASLFIALADFLSTVFALAGFSLATLNYPLGDTLTSIMLSGFLVYLSIKLLRGSFQELIDAVPKDLAERIRPQVLSMEKVIQCKDLKVRRVGQKYFIEITVTAPEGMSLKEAHDLTSKIEQNIAKAFGDCSVTIHVEPEKEK
jgi:cation diffusion facilitator family transporter